MFLCVSSSCVSGYGRGVPHACGSGPHRYSRYDKVCCKKRQRRGEEERGREDFTYEHLSHERRKSAGSSSARRVDNSLSIVGLWVV